MAEREHLDWFRARLAASRAKEKSDPAPVLEWREQRRGEIRFEAELIPLRDVRGWGPDEGGNIRHESGQFFGVEGVRVEAGSLREVRGWDQPIYTQPEGGVLAMVARETDADGVQFLLQAKAEPGNIGTLQLVPSLQCTWSNMRRVHKGSNPPLTELLDGRAGVRWVYRAQHNEEGGRFWRKSNENAILFLDDEALIETDLTLFYWASQTQIKELALIDNVLSPFVKTIMAPL
jgi:dTDP-4-dehydro-6-deoxy-alpha-D-glucopyranose 2,3-dehydratase